MNLHKWKRYWCPREGALNLSDGGYLLSPEGELGRFIQQDLRSYEEISAIPCLILLGEPGIGKTTALREIAAFERNSNTSVVIELGEFSTDDRLIRELFESRELQQWQTGTHTLSILLDGLDECHVPGVAKLLARRFEKLPTNRLRLRLTCRTAEWPSTLEQALRSAWGDQNTAVYELAPLTKADVAKAATGEGLSADLFLREIARTHAEALAIKPVSLRFLIEEFRESSLLPADESCLYERGCGLLCEESLERRENNGTPTATTKERLAIAKRIAYLTLLARKSAVWIGLSSECGPTDLPLDSLFGTEFLDAREFEVTEAAVRETLNTGLFTARGPHRMGWAHQTYAEFLAAQYLILHLECEQRRSLLLLTDEFGVGVVPQLSEVAARVATSSSGDFSLFEEILRTAPALLLSGSVASLPEQQRERLVDALLRKVGELSHREVHRTDRLCHLRHPRIARQLKPFIKRSWGDAGALALHILDACGVDALWEEILDMALDEESDIDLRCRALNALGNHLDSAMAERIRPLVEGSANDPKGEIKASALRILWPGHLSTEELLACLTPPDQNHYIGDYGVFMSHEVPARLRPEDLPVALAWVGQQKPQYSLDESTCSLINGVLLRAWQLMDKPGVCPALAKALADRLVCEYGHIAESSELRESGFLDDPRKRRELLSRIVPQIREVKDYDGYLLTSRIARLEDLHWLVDRAKAADDAADARSWVALCHRIVLRNQYADVDFDILVAAHSENPERWAKFDELLQPIALDSPLAAQLRKEEHQCRRLRKEQREAPASLGPPPALRIQQVLDRCEKGELDLWMRLVKELSLRPHRGQELPVTERDSRPALVLRSTSRPNRAHYGRWWEPDITEFPGWDTIPQEIQSRIPEAAKRYLWECDDRRQEWIEDDSSVGPFAIAGYQALRLLHTCEPTSFEEIGADVWGRWAAALFCYYLQFVERESVQSHAPLIDRLFSVAPREAFEALEVAMVRESRASETMRWLLRSLPRAHMPELFELLKKLITRRQLAGPGAEQVFRFLVAQDDASMTEWVANRIPDLVPMGELEREYALSAATACCLSGSAKCWDTIWKVMNNDMTFGRTLVESFAASRPPSANFCVGLTADQLADLYLWVSREFSHLEDPDVPGVHVVSHREAVAHWRDGHLLRQLTDAGTLEACRAVRRIVDGLPELSWLRLAWQDTVKAMRAQSWCPLEVDHLLKLTASRNSQAVSSGGDLLRLIQKSLDRLQEELRGNPTVVKQFWDYQHETKTWRPKEENAISDCVVQHLRHLLQGAAVNREVEIRPRRGTAAGQRTDILVEALPGRTEADTVRVIIENKGCWHRKLDVAMKTQLVDRYLRDNQRCKHGLYLVAYFWCESWDPSDGRKTHCTEGIDDIERNMKRQSKELSDSETTVCARVLDLRLDVPPAAPEESDRAN